MSKNVSLPIKLEWKDGVVAVLSAIIFLRLIIWKLVPGADLFLREDGANTLIATLTLVVVVMFFITKFWHKELLTKTGFEAPLLTMSIAAGLSLFWTADIALTLRLLVSFLSCAAFFIILVDCLDSPARRKFFLWALVFFAVLTAIVAIKDFFVLMSLPVERAAAEQRSDLQYILMNRRATSFIGWPNSLAGYLLLTLPFVGLGIFSTQGRKKWLFIVMGLVMALGFLVTFSFLGWTSFILASLVMMPFVLMPLIKALTPQMKKALVVVVVVLGLFFVVVIVRKNFSGAIAPRKIYYEHTFKLIAQKPLLGHGFGTYGVVSRPWVTSQAGITNYPHNTYLQWWIEAGFLGFAGIVWFLVLFAGMVRRVVTRGLNEQGAWVTMALAWGLVAFFIDNFFSFTFIKPNIAFHAWAAMALFTAYVLADEGKPKGLPKRSWYPMVIAGIVAGGVLVLSLILFIGCWWYSKGTDALKQRDLDRAGQAFVQGSLFDRWSAAYPVAAGNLAVAVFRASGKEYHLRLAEVNFVEAVRREPLFYANHYILSDIYARLGNRETAIKYARQARELSPFEYDRSVVRNQMKKNVK